MLPNYIKESLEAYANEGRPTGGFLQAVLENDLMQAIGRADCYNEPLMVDICSYVYNHMPISCHGSPKIVADWLQRFRN